MPVSHFGYLHRDELDMPAGAFDRRVTFQNPVQTEDGMGGYTVVWSPFLTTWAHIEPWRGRELWRDMQIYPNMWERVFIRYRPSLAGIAFNASMRIMYGTRTLNIRSVYHLAEGRRLLSFLCEELQATGTAH